MPRKTVRCTRLYRDDDGTPKVCGASMTFCPGDATWTCPWCGLIVPALHVRP